MRKYTLIKFFNGEATEQEIDRITEWVNKSPLNKAYFIEQKNLYSVLSANMHQSAKSAVDMKQGIHSGKKGGFFGKAIIYITSAAAIALIFFVIGIKSNLTEFKVLTPIPALNTAPIENTLYTERGVKGFLVLPDSTKVWLNSDSRLTYPEVFSGDTRNVQLVGEAYFEVRRDTLHPMIVNTNKNFSIEVLGTSFNVKCYDNDLTAETTLYSGSILMHYKNVTTAQNETLLLKPNESFTYTTGKIPVSVNYPKPEIKKEWKDGKLYFNNTPMTEVIKTLERWHGTQFIVHNSNIYHYRLTAEFSSESIVQIMEIMKILMPIEYACDNNVVTLK